MMNKEFVPYEISKELKELGFDEMSFGYYGDANELRLERFVDKDKDLLKAPLWQQAFDFFREKHNLHGAVDFDEIDGKFYYFINPMNNQEINWSKSYSSYEDARLNCLKKLIEFIKKVV